MAWCNYEATSPAPGFCYWDPLLAGTGTSAMAFLEAVFACHALSWGHCEDFTLIEHEGQLIAGAVEFVIDRHDYHPLRHDRLPIVAAQLCWDSSTRVAFEQQYLQVWRDPPAQMAPFMVGCITIVCVGSDLWFGISAHRSIITHSFLIPFLLFWWTHRKPARMIANFMGIGICAAMAAHFCFDLFPAAWRGSALITLPIFGRTNALFSQLWLWVSSVVCLFLAYTWLPTARGVKMSIGMALLSFALMIQSSFAAFMPLISLLGAIIAALHLAARQYSDIQQLQQTWWLKFLQMIASIGGKQHP